MKMSELFEADYIKSGIKGSQNTYALNGSMSFGKDKKVGQADDVKIKNAYVRGFRAGFSDDDWDDIGIASTFVKHAVQGEKDGIAARKAYKDEIPQAKTVKNSYGEKKPNQAFEKIVKSVMAPYLEKMSVKEDLNESLKDDVMGKTKAEVTRIMKAAGYPREKIPGGEGSHEAAYRSTSGFDWYFAMFANGKLISLRKRG